MNPPIITPSFNKYIKPRTKFKKGNYVYYVNLSGDTYPTKIIAVGSSGQRKNSVLITLKTFKSNVEYRRWVNICRIELQRKE